MAFGVGALKRLGTSLRRVWLAALLFTVGAAFGQSYVVTDLGAPGELASYAVAINTNGLVIGYSVHDAGMTNRAWKWTSATGRVYLGGFGGDEARALGLNEAGQITGYATDAGGLAHGFIFDGGVMTDLGPAPEGGAVYAQSINSLGHVAGYTMTSNGPVPFLWTNGGALQLLGTLPGADAPASAVGYDLNDSDTVVGEGSWLFGGLRAFVIAAGGANMGALPTLGGETATSYGINNAGFVVGEAETTNGAQHAFLYDGLALHDLGTLGGADSTAFSINVLGDVVGTAEKTNGLMHAFVWSAGEGLEDLQPLIDPTLGWVLNEAHGISEDGLIVGNGTFNGQPRAFLLTPRVGPDTNSPVVIAALSKTAISAVDFSPVFLTLTVWDDVAVEANTVFVNSVRVTGPGGYSVLASFTGRSPYSSNTIQNVATYQISPRGGVWDGADSGVCTVSLEPNSVRDITGNFVPPQTLGTFTVSIQTNPAVAVAGPATLTPGGTANVTITAQSSYPTSNSFTFAIDWDGNGTVDETISGPSPQTVPHTFATVGIYNVAVTATDAHALTATGNLEITVTPGQPSWVAAPTPGYRSGAAGLNHNGRLYLIGGAPLVPLDGGDSRVDYLNAGEASWLPGTVLDGDLYNVGAGVDAMNRIIVFGGHTLEGGPRASGFVYSPGSGQGGGIASRHFATAGFAFCADNLKRLYSIGGGGSTNVERYTVSGNSWTVLAPLPAGINGGAAAYDGLGRIIVVAGTTTYAYDIAGNAWSQLANAPQSHTTGQQAALGADGLIYVLNGTSLMVFDPVSGGWGMGPNSTHAHSSLVAGNDGYIYGLGLGYEEKLNVSAGAPPTITSTAPLFATNGVTWNYAVVVGGSPHPGIFLHTAPAGMSVNAAGFVTWTPTPAQIGTQLVVIRATNATGVAQQRFNVVVPSTPFGGGDLVKPTAPTNLVATNITDVLATLRWNASTDNVAVVGYRLYTYSTKCSGFRCIRKATVATRIADDLTATTITRSGLLSGRNYTFGVAAFDAAGNESAHTKVTFLTQSPPRIVPGYVTAQSLQFAVVDEPWQQQFQVFGNPLPTLSFVSGPAGMTFSNNTVIWNPVTGPAGTNFFTLRAANALTNLEQTFSVFVHPAGTDLVPPSAPTGVAVSSVGPDRVSVAWNAATDNYGIAGYHVSAVTSVRTRRVCGRGCRPYRYYTTTQFSPGTNTSFTLKDLNPGTKYSIYVRAVDTAGLIGPASGSPSYSQPYTYGTTFTTVPLYGLSLAALPGGDLLFSWEVPEPPQARLGDFYNYTVLCAPALSNTVWNPLPGVAWPTTNNSVIVPASAATNTFYKVRADWITH